MLPSRGAAWLSPIVVAMATHACTRAPGPAPHIEARRGGQENFIARALFADGRLWLLSDAGDLSSVVRGGEKRIGTELADPVLDACVHDGQLKVITCERQACEHWTIHAWAGGKWRVEGVLPGMDEAVIALSCIAGTDTVLTTRHMVRITGSGATVVPLSQALPQGVASVHGAGESLFVGINAGEWGGGLSRIDADGRVSAIEKNATGELCDGPLNTGCDPVNGIVDDPWRPGCVAAAIGLVHFSPHGRIVEICGDEVHRVYFKPYGEPKKNDTGHDQDEPFETVAFYGLSRAGNSVLAVGLDGIYRFDGWDQVTMTPLPSFRSIDGVGVSFDVPGFVLVLTGINQRHAIGGNAPLLIPR